MTVVSDVITWTRRLLKSGNTQDITDSTILTYLNRFYVYDVPYQIQQFELKTQYSFETEANVDRYNLPIDQYNSILTPLFCDGLQITMCQSTDQFSKLFPSLYFNTTSATGTGSSGPYAITLSQVPLVRGHTDVLGAVSPGLYITATDGGGSQMVVTDDGNGNLIGDGSGTVSYTSGAISVTFDSAVPSGNDINTQTIPYTSGRPTAMLFFNNVMTLRVIPDKAYLITMDAYMTPSAFLSTSASVTFGWMADYLAHGTARRILKDLGDMEQLQMYEPFFKEQERQVLRRTIRQNSNARTATIFQSQIDNSYGNFGQN
jgi:hypothetical protein